MKPGAGFLGGNSVGWDILFRQEGISFASVNGGKCEHAVLVAFGPPEPGTLELVGKHCAEGGALLCSGRILAGLAGLTVKRRSISCLIPANDSLFEGAGLLDIYSIGERITGAEHCADKLGKPAVFTGVWNGAPVVALPFDPGSLILDGRSSTKSFYGKTARFPFERVSLVSKGGLRRLVSSSLEFLHHRLEMPYLHLWHHPGGSQVSACFRVDTDGAGRDDLERLYAVITEHGLNGTWFLDAKSQEPHFPFYRSMNGQEIGVHGDIHETYGEYEKNLANFSAGRDRLRDAGFATPGAAAPFGLWNDGLKQCYRELGFEYSSEFSYDYDNRPSLPPGGGYATFQIPVHPVSVGSLRRQGYGPEEMTDYFSAYTERMIVMREPVMVYHHPRNGHEEVLKSYFELLNRHAVPVRPMHEIARWWALRWNTVPDLRIEGTMVGAGPAGVPEGCTIHCTLSDGRESWLSSPSLTELSSLRWSARPQAPPLPSDLKRIRRFNPWIPVTRAEDYVYRKLRH
jgi:hypothetical protein